VHFNPLKVALESTPDINLILIRKQYITDSFG